jgi:hypothetical protein
MDLFKLLNLSKPSAEGQRSKPRPGGKRQAENVELLRRAIPLLPPYIRRTIRNQMSGGERLRVLFLIIAQYLPGLRSYCRTPAEFVEPYIQAIPPMKVLILLWLSTMHRYLGLHEKGVPILAVQYETLVGTPLPALRAIFEYCGLQVEEAELAYRAFDEDSQKGTPMSRDRVGWQKRGDLDPELLVQLREVLREHPPVQTPDFIVPNSLDLRRAGK